MRLPSAVGLLLGLCLALPGLVLSAVVQGDEAGAHAQGLEVPSEYAAAFARAAEADPLGKTDVFAHITDREREFWSRDKGGTLEDKISYLENIEVTTAVEIRLVGFDGDGNHGLLLGEQDFSRLLESIKSTFQAHVIEGAHDLALKTKFYFRVSKAPRQLSGNIRSKIQKAVSSSPRSPDSTIATIPHSEVDSLIAEDFRASELSSFIVYILNPHAPDAPQGKGTVKYAYRYGAGAFGGHPGPDCAGPLYVGKERYVWVDLTAGPLRYGPRTIGKGLVGEHTLPRVAGYPSDTRRSLLSADIVALVRSACEHLASPPMQHFPIRYWEETEVRVVRIRDADLGAGRADSMGLDIKAVERELQGVRLRGQKVTVKVTDVVFGECDLCVAAYTRALRAHATGSHAAHSYAPVVHEYLDSAELRHRLRACRDGLLEEAGLGGVDAGSHGRVGGRRVLMVYLYDLPTEEPLLLDRHHQALAFPDMVLAVRTRAPQTVLDFTCEGGAVLMDPREMTRPLLAAVLQSGWGVAATEDTWRANSTQKSYLWSVGQTPFGPLSSGSLSFAQRDAAMRNVLLSHANVTVAEASRLLGTLARLVPAGGAEAQLPALAGGLYTAHWNVLRHKLERAASYLALGKHDACLYYVRSCDHELAALQRAVHATGSALQTSLQCFQEAPFPWASYLLLLGVGASGAWVWRRRAVLGLSKNKAI